MGPGKLLNSGNWIGHFLLVHVYFITQDSDNITPCLFQNVFNCLIDERQNTVVLLCLGKASAGHSLHFGLRTVIALDEIWNL